MGQAKSDRLMETQCFSGSPRVDPEALSSMCPAGMDEGIELTGWGGKEHKHGTHGTWAPCVSLTSFLR